MNYSKDNALAARHLSTKKLPIDNFLRSEERLLWLKRPFPLGALIFLACASFLLPGLLLLVVLGPVVYFLSLKTILFPLEEIFTTNWIMCFSDQECFTSAILTAILLGAYLQICYYAFKMLYALLRKDLGLKTVLLPSNYDCYFITNKRIGLIRWWKKAWVTIDIPVGDAEVFSPKNPEPPHQDFLLVRFFKWLFPSEILIVNKTSLARVDGNIRRLGADTKDALFFSDIVDAYEVQQMLAELGGCATAS